MLSRSTYLREPSVILFFLVWILLSVVATLMGDLRLVLLIPIFLLIVWWLRRPDILFLTLMVSLPWSIETMVTAQLGMDLPDEFLMWIMSIFVILHMARFREKWYGLFSAHPLTLLLLFQMIWLAASVGQSEHPWLSLKFFLAKGWYLLACTGGAWLFLAGADAMRKHAAAILISLCSVVLLILIRHAAHGFSFESVSRVCAPFFRNHVNYSAMLACLLPLPLAGLALGSGHRKILWGIFSLLVLALIFSYSRGAWMAALAGSSALFLIRKKWLGMVMPVSVLAILTFFLFFRSDNRYLRYRPDFNQTIYHEKLTDHLAATYRLRDLSTAERVYRWIAALRMMPGHWIYGYGPNSFYHEYRPHTLEAFRTYVSDNPERSTVHNYFLLLLTEQGLPGWLLFVWLLHEMLLTAQRIYHRSKERFYQVAGSCFAYLTIVVIVLISLSDLIETDKLGCLFYISIGCLIRLDRKVSAPSDPAGT